LKPLSIDKAKAAHRCKHNQTHRLQKGDIRLRLKVERTQQYFCASCASQSIKADIEHLNDLLSALNNAGA
jgi:hypothetical protein